MEKHYPEKNETIESIQIIKDDEIDLLALMKTIWAGRKIIIYSLALSIIVGLVIAFTSPRQYTASATLLPSVEKKGGNLGNLSALAGMAGINIGSFMSDPSGIPADLYPQVVNSVPFLMELMHEKLTWSKHAEPLSMLEALQSDTIMSAMGKLKKYTIGLPRLLKNSIIKGSQSNNELHKGELANHNIDYITLTSMESAALGSLKKAIKLTHDKKSGLVNVQVVMSEPLLSAQLADKAVKLLQKHIIDYKTKQSQENFLFIQERFTEAKNNYEQTQQAFFAYKDAHRNIVAERMDLEFQRLSDAYDISLAIYKGLAQQQEQAKIAVKEETPVFKVLNPVVVPMEKSAPKRGMIMAVSVLIGFFAGITAVLILLYLRYKISM